MNIVVLSLLFLSLSSGVTEAQGRRRRPKGFLAGILGGDEDCPDPSDFVAQLSEITCCEEQCSAYVPSCLEDLSPTPTQDSSPTKDCFIMKDCKPSRKDIRPILQNKDRHQIVLGMIVECSERKKFEMMNIQYIPDDPVTSQLNYLNYITGVKNLGDVGFAMINAVTSGKCVPPSKDNFSVASKIGFNICLLKTCADFKASTGQVLQSPGLTGVDGGQIFVGDLARRPQTQQSDSGIF